jgi:hypothetical protein
MTTYSTRERQLLYEIAEVSKFAARKQINSRSLAVDLLLPAIGGSDRLFDLFEFGIFVTPLGVRLRQSSYEAEVESKFDARIQSNLRSPLVDPGFPSLNGLKKFDKPFEFGEEDTLLGACPSISGEEVSASINRPLSELGGSLV